MRMKPVHFATGFLLSLHGKYRRLEYLNKAANPKAVEKRPGDPYVLDNLLEELKETGGNPLDERVTPQDFALLRNHLKAVFGNDGAAAIAPAFAPYKTFGYDVSTPSPMFLAEGSKNHGQSGAFLWTALNSTSQGRDCLALAGQIFSASGLPASVMGTPLVEKDAEDYDGPAQHFPEEYPVARIQSTTKLMETQTTTLLLLLENLRRTEPAYALRQMIIGLGSWLVLYLIQTADSGKAVLFADFCGGSRPRVRTQARACFARTVSRFGQLVTSTDYLLKIGATEEEITAASSLKGVATQEFEEHFNDFAMRIGWVQPRVAKKKHFEAVPDTLRVLLTSILREDEVVTMDEIAKRLLEKWRLCIGLVPSDHLLLQQHRYAPLDHDSDLRANREAFKNLAVRLGLAREPSDGLVLFSLDPQPGL